MRSLIVIVLLLMGSTAFGQSYTKISDPTECKSRINEKARNTRSISAKFDEEIHSSMFNSVQKGTGLLKYKKENKIRWEHFTPKKQIVLINGTKVKMKENGREVKNVTSNQIIKRVQSLMIQLFSGEFLNEKDFRIQYYQNNDYYKLILEPKSNRMSKYISQVEMYFFKKSLKLRKMVMQETGADKIVYSFSSVTFNADLSDSNFTTF